MTLARITRTREQVLAMYEVYQGGETLDSIAEREGCKRQRIGQLFEEHHLPRRRIGASSSHLREIHERRAQQEREHIIELYKRHGTIDDVVAQVHLPRRLISEIVATIPNQEMYRRRGTYVTRSREELIADLRRAAIEGESLTIPDYRKMASKHGLASLDTHVKMFGSWPAALSAAGIQGNEPRGTRSDSITAQQCITAVARCWQELDRRPSYDLYRVWAKGKGVPSGPTVRSKVGTWNAAVQLALDSLDRA